MENPSQMPVFIKIEEYKKVLDILRVLRSKVNEANKTIARIDELKNNEDTELENWKASLKEIEDKIAAIDESLFGPENY